MKSTSKISKIAIVVPILFLLFYHISKLYTIYFEDDMVNSNNFLHSFQDAIPVSAIITIQSILRGIIIISLALIIFRKNIGPALMWLGIGTLISTQFFIVSQSNHELILSIHSGLKPLKSLILPIVITYLYNKINPTKISNHVF
ncbi:hypothetical protein [Aquimarina megaterium]|uniref:hypothetical protein n=1 Tax=Aquimarina megaterium TaxID=1443666 RepID=UPI00046F0C20|nr:hypothetical protein [Aquimarina megaterium]